MVGSLLLLSRIALGTECGVPLEQAGDFRWSAAATLPAQLVGRILEVRFFSPDRSRWRAMGFGFTDLRRVHGFDPTGRKVVGLAPTLFHQPTQIGQLTQVNGRAFTLQRPRRDGSRRILTFEEGISWSAETNEHREIERRPLDPRDQILYRVIVRPLFWYTTPPAPAEPPTDSVENR